MKKKTIKKHLSLLYKASTIQQTYCDSDEWPAPLDSYHFVTIKKCKKHFTKKQLLRLLSDRQAVNTFVYENNIYIVNIDQIIDILKHHEAYKNRNRFSLLLIDDIFCINYRG